MTNEELSKLHSLMKKVFLTSFVIYALFVFCIFYFLGNILSPTLLITIIIFAPMIIGGIVLFIVKIKNPPVIDENDDSFKGEITTETTETED